MSGDKGPCSFKKPLEDREGRRATLAIFQIFIQGKELQCRKLKVCFVGDHDWWFVPAREDPRSLGSASSASA